MVRKALVLGAGGFIGSHMVSRLKKEGYWVRGVDLKNPEYSNTDADQFIIGKRSCDDCAIDFLNSSHCLLQLVCTGIHVSVNTMFT